MRIKDSSIVSYMSTFQAPLSVCVDADTWLHYKGVCFILNFNLTELSVAFPGDCDPQLRQGPGALRPTDLLRLRERYRLLERAQQLDRELGFVSVFLCFLESI
jgi:hypothetical protein